MNTKTERVEVCIVGAGIAGLNALFVVSKYLKKGQRVALVDQREQVGGMWVDVYDYVRLHQPHPFFTAGNIKWQWDKDPSYLASKPEVLAHMQHCLDELRSSADVAEFLGWSYLGHEETGAIVRTTVERNGERVVIESSKLVKALGFNVSPNHPLRLTSSRVRSESPDFCDVRTGEIADSDAPVWVIGGGKTAMDTALALLSGKPGREVNLVAGSGTYFWRRDELYAAKRRLRRGTRPNLATERLTRGYDGGTEAGYEAFQGTLLTAVTPQAANYKLGILSDAEADRIRSGVSTVLMDHLMDVVDVGDRVEMVLRSGRRLPIEAGSWIVNCTGYLLKHERAYEPYCSPGGRVLSINQRSTTLLFTSYAGYYMTHLFMRGRLDRAPLYELDWDTLDRQTKAATVAALSALMYNFTVLVDELPARVMLTSGLDVDRWYPAPRRLLGGLNFLATHRRFRQYLRASLAAVQARHDIRCGPLGAEILPLGSAPRSLIDIRGSGANK
jgi:hypothetical protein